MIRKLILLLLLLNSINIFSLTIEDYIESGERSLLKQDYYGAIDYFKEALRINHRDLKANRGLSDSFFMIGEYEEAHNYIKVCLELGKNNLEIKNRQGRIYTALEKYDEAKEIYLGVIKEEMYNVGAQSGLAELRVVTGDIKGSLYDFEKILKFSPNSRRLLLSASILYDKQKRFKDSGVLIQKALRSYPGDPIVLEAAVRHYMVSRDYQGATIYMHELTRVSSSSSVILLKAELLLLLGDFDNGIKTITEYMKIEKNNPKSYYLAAFALNSTGKYKQAISLLKRGLDIKPDEEIYRFFKEQIVNDLYSLNDKERTKYSNWYLDQGRALEDRFYYNKSKTYYLRGLDLDPLSLDLRVSYANILKRMNFHKRYLKELDIVLNHNKDNSEIKETLMIQNSLPSKTIYERWGDETFKKSNLFNLSVFVNESSREFNLFSHRTITDISSRFLSSHRRFSSRLVESYSGEFSKAFNRARESESDFFLLIGFNEGSRTFTLSGELYLTKSGRKIKSFNYLKTGNNRILNCFDSLSKDIDDFFPKIGSVTKISGSDVLLDIGRYEDVVIDGQYDVVKKGHIVLSPKPPYVIYEDDKYLGRVVITDVGESMSQGSYKSISSFNLLNIGDIVISVDPESEESNSDDLSPKIIDTELIEQLLLVNY